MPESNPMTEIRAEVDRINDALDQIERAAMAIDDANEWRAALGLVHAAGKRTYQVRGTFLDEAMRRSAEIGV